MNQRKESQETPDGIQDSTAAAWEYIKNVNTGSTQKMLVLDPSLY